MKILDYTSDLRDLIVSSLAAVDRLVPIFQRPAARPNDYLRRAAPDLLALLAEIYQIRRFARLGARPIDDPGGLGTGLDDSAAPAVMSTVKGKETWDFQPWLAEKTRSVEGLVFKVCEICAPADRRVERPRWRRVRFSGDPGEKCCRHFEGVRTYFGIMLQLIDSGELKICQLSAEEENENEEEEK